MIEHMGDVNFSSPRSPTRMRTTRTTSTTMTKSPTSPSSISSSRISLSKRDTGFPPGFSGRDRTTSLPHPNANLSPDACITEDDINITRALARHRMSFIAQKEKQHRISRGMALNSIEETGQHHQQQHVEQYQPSESSKGGSLLAGGRDPSFSTVGRLALSSLHGAEFRRHLRRPGSNGTNDSVDSTVSNASTTANYTIVSSVFSEEGQPRLSGSVASTAPSSPTPYNQENRDDELDKNKALGNEASSKDPRGEKRDPRDGRIPLAAPTPLDSGASVSEKSSIRGKGLKKRKSFMWFHRLIHR